MKTFKKISLGLLFLSVLMAITISLLPARKAAAASFTRADITGATYTFQDGANISAKFNFSSEPVIFTDGNSSDSTRNYTPQDNGILCDPGDIANQNGLNGKMKYGINISSTADLTQPTISAQIKIDYFVGSNCDKNNAILANISIKNPSQSAATDFQWDGDQIKSLNGSSDSETLTLLSNSNGLVYTTFGGSCGSGDVILLDSANGNTGKLYSMSPVIVAQRGGGAGQNLSSYPAIAPYFDASKCRVDSGPKNITIAGQAGKAASGGAGSAVPTGDSCELDSGGFSLSWFMCPLLTAANDLVNGSNGNSGLLGMFEKQLSFNVNRDLGTVGGGTNEVQTTWSLIKNIASAILVIIMLVMVFSQAISAGPFDAYTIRKILPRLVAAVILMQLSWYIVAFFVDLVDDIGNSLFDLLYAPFGGSNTLDLGHLLAHANIGTGQAIVIDFVAIVGTVVLGLASLPAVLFLAFSAVVALFTALIVLIFRKIIIIFCLIFAPLAILAWILPGTQRYWKLWYDNFTKVLMMFPLIVGLIAAGHIFAFVVGTQGNGTFLNLIFVMVGVFGPLFVLPKTYKWGGQAMSLAGGAIHSVGNQIQKRSEQGIKGFGERQQGKWAKAYDPQKGLANRTMRRIQSGHILPTKRSQRLAIAAGDKWSQERDEEALALIKRKGEKAMRDGYEAAVLTDDKRNFAKYRMDAKGNYLDKDNKVLYTRQANGTYKDNDGNEVTKFGDEVKMRVNTFDEADKRTLTGVAAMKQMWVDLADEGRDSHEKKMAIRQLTATSSWPEVQGSLSRGGKKVIDTDAWADSITTSPEDYPRILRSRVDATPHIDNDAKAQLAQQKSAGRVFTPDEERDYIASRRVHYSIKNQMSNEDFATQSEGFWQEVNRTANLTDEDGNLTEEAQEIRAELAARFEAIRSIGGTAPQQLLGHLVGGSVQAEVDGALGPGKSVLDYIQRSPAQQSPQNPTGQQGGGATISDDETEVDLHPDDENPPPNQP